MMAQKIASARTRWLRVPLQQPLGGGRITVAETFVVDLETDQGLTGRAEESSGGQHQGGKAESTDHRGAQSLR